MISGKGVKWLVLMGLAATLLVLSEASGLAQSDSPDLDTFGPPKSLKAAYVPGEVLVKFKNSPATFRGKPSREHFPSVHGAAAAEFAAALPNKARASLEAMQGEVVRAHPNIGLLRVKLPAHVSVSQALEHLHRSGAVEYAEPNGLINLQGTPGDPLFGSQWALPQIKAPDAWDIVYPGNVVPPGSNNTIVAVVDTGVDYLHESFYVTIDNPLVRRYTLPADTPLYFPGDPLTSNLWTNHGEEVDDPYNPGGPKVFIKNLADDDANNFVDDYFGINTSVTPSTGDPMDPSPSNGGHGTAMAGIIGAVGNNSIGMTGVNWQTRIMALRFANAGGGTVDNAITCINYALAKRGTAPNGKPTPLVITLGWKQAQNTYYNSLHDALRIVQDQGALVVAAAGNDGEDNDIIPNFPSSYNHDIKDFPVVSNISADNVISVGGSDQSDKKETNSSYGLATVDLFAPGKDIVCTTTPPSTPTPPPVHTNYASGTGTSYATAHVAGACALLWNRYPDKDWKQIKAMIMNGAEDGAAPNDFRAICVTEGRLNLANSLNPAIENAPAIFSIFEVTPAPGDPAVVPGRADTGDLLVITGVNFGGGGAGSTISFLDTTFPAANLVSWSDEKIVATVPVGLPKGVGRLLVTNAAGLTSRGACFSNISRERQVGSLSLARGLAASAQVGNNVYIIGGRTYWGIVPQVERYSLATNHAVIDSLWAMPIPVSNAGAASIGAKIYVVGGATEDPATTNAIPVANVQIFDTTTQTWTFGAPLPKSLMQCAVTSSGAKVYAFGGLVKSASSFTYTAVTDAYVYDPATNAWTQLAVLPTATAYAAAAPTASGNIWVMGGFNGSSTTSQQTKVWEYDPAKDQWTQQLHLVRPRGGAAGLNFAGKVYSLRGTKAPLLGGSNYDEYADGEWYNSGLGYWMPSIMNYLGIWVAPTPNVFYRTGLYTPSPGKYIDKIYLLGGATGTATSPYKYDYSNKVWAFPAPGGGVEGGGRRLAWVPMLLLDD